MLSKWFPKRPTHKNHLLKDGQVFLGGPYRSMDVAITRERSDRWYPHLLRRALERGYSDRWGKRNKPTLADIADWTGHSTDTLRAWLKPTTVKSHRNMPRHAIRLILHEFSLRDHSSYDWAAVLRHCQ